MKASRFLKRLARDARGTYLVEFAVIALPLITMLMGGIELGYLAYSKSNVEGALREVSRLAATGSATEEELDTLFNARVGHIKNASVKIERKSYSAFGAVGQPEPMTSDVAPFGGTPGPGDCYLDINGNEQWDADRGAEGLGESEDILYYGVTVTYPMIFTLTSGVLNGGKPNMSIDANVVIKNEPFSNLAQPAPENRCIPA